MKKKHFYSHLVETSSLSLVLGEMELSQEERMHLISLVDSNLHHHILDIVLSELSDDDKKTFLQHIATEKHDKVWELLNTKVEKIEEKITKAAEDLKRELHKDIREVQST